MPLSPAQAEAKKQALLFAIVVDIQQRSLKSYQLRSMRRAAVGYVMAMTPIALFLVALPVLLYAWHFLVADVDGNSPVAGFVASFPNYGLFTAVSFGALGALFSRFIVLQQSELQVPIDDAAAYYGFPYILLRIVVGIVGSIIIYFFIGSGLIDGPLVPDIRKLSFEPVILDGAKVPPVGVSTLFGKLTTTAMVPTRDLALLIIWSFLAGFSERLVPNLLTSTSDRIEERYKQGTPSAKS